MATYTAVGASELKAFLDGYGLRLSAFGGIAEGSVNSNYWVEAEGAEGKARWFLRLFEEQGTEGAEGEAELLRRLAAGGVPTPAPLADLEGRGVGRLAERPASLFPWRSGGMRCQRAVRPEDTDKLGRALALLHRAGRGIARGPGRFRHADLEVRLDRVDEDGSEELRSRVPALRAALADNAARRRADLPSGIVHGDLFRDNVLYAEDGTLTALLDFESAFHGPLVYDLAVTLLAWCYGASFEEDLARALFAGYEAERPLEPREREALWDEAVFAALRFTVTRITDFAMRETREIRDKSDGGGPRVMKDYRRFLARHQWLIDRGPEGLSRLVFGAS